MAFSRRITGILILGLAAHALQAGIIPTIHLDPEVLKTYEDYVATWEKNSQSAFRTSGKLWIDSSPRKDVFQSGKIVLEPIANKEIRTGSIHHFSGVVHVKGATINQVRKVMQDYPNYLKIFKGDLGAASGSQEADSKPDDEHFISKLLLVQGTLWINVTYDAQFDTRYIRSAPDRWEVHSKSLSIKELTDPKNYSSKPFEGDDHGFLWRTNTYWFVRERGDGIDIEAHSIALSRPAPTGFSWWGNKRSRDAVDKMIRDTMAALPSHQ